MMIIRDIENLPSKCNVVESEWFTSYRFLIADDRLGYSMHLTKTKAGSKNSMQYKHHVETVFCIKGIGEITDYKSGDIYIISPGVSYTLDKHDKHILEAKTDLELLCVFNPACKGLEIHDSDGSYPPP